MMIVDVAYPMGNGMCSPRLGTLAMIEPSSATKMKVNVAKMTFDRTEP